MSRYAGFTFTSPKNYRGRARYTLPTIPARDLTARDVARLSPEQYESVKLAKLPNGKPLYAPIKVEKDDESAEEAPADEMVVEVEFEPELPAE